MQSTGQFGAPEKVTLPRALDDLWRRFLPEIAERVAALESAVAAVNAQNLGKEQCKDAQAAAHKLAGVLGSFGLARGTNLARELELIFANESLPGSDASAHLAAIVAELRRVVENREPSA